MNLSEVLEHFERQLQVPSSSREYVRLVPISARMPVGRIFTTELKYRVVDNKETIPPSLLKMKWSPFFADEIDNITSELVVLSRFKVERAFVKKLLKRKDRLSRIVSPYFVSGIFKLETTGLEPILNKVFERESAEYCANVAFDGNEHVIVAVGNGLQWIPMGFNGFYLRDAKTAFYLGETITM